MRVRFTKMHGLGNDFVVFDATRSSLDLTAEQARRIADRHFGIGCDQILLVEPARTPGNDFAYRIFNADGNEVEQCGNGARCFARYVYDKGLSCNTRLRVETKAGVIMPVLGEHGLVSVDMGAPIFTPAAVPFLTDREAATYFLNVGGELIEFGVLSMGNPHAVTVVDDLQAFDLARLGPVIQSHPSFPASVNAGVMKIETRQKIGLRVFERGAGETLACGTGACAAVVSGIVRGLLDSPVSVQTRGGELTIAWPGGAASVVMTGPAVTVFEGEIEI